jgi:signal transduction histidine kinase
MPSPAESATEQALRQELARRERELLALSNRFVDLHEQDRRHVARELHDEIGQCLSAIRLQFARLQRRAESPESLALIASAADMTERTLDSVRSLSRLLHPPQLETLGLAAALRWHLDEQQRLHTLAIRLDSAALPELPQDLALAVYRIVQEALSNTLRHAGARRFDVTLRLQADALILGVSDDGRGFDARAGDGGFMPPSGLGLVGMAARARLLGGELAVVSAPGQGTQIAASFPIHAHGHDEKSTGDPG